MKGNKDRQTLQTVEMMMRDWSLELDSRGVVGRYPGGAGQNERAGWIECKLHDDQTNRMRAKG